MNNKTGKIKLNKYKPTEGEPFMNPKQLEYFKHKIMEWKEDIINGSSETLNHLKDSSSVKEADLNDQATNETDRSIELRTRDRERKLLSKIDAALERINNGTYGYCEETGEPISLKRLEARPIATLSIEAQERHEKDERTHRDDDVRF
jgi:DnaK suppressor protein